MIVIIKLVHILGDLIIVVNTSKLKVGTFLVVFNEPVGYVRRHYLLRKNTGRRRYTGLGTERLTTLRTTGIRRTIRRIAGARRLTATLRIARRGIVNMTDPESQNTNGVFCGGATVPLPVAPIVLPWNRKRSFDAMVEEAVQELALELNQQTALSVALQEQNEARTEHRGDEMFFVEPPDVSELRSALVRASLRMEAWLDALIDDVEHLKTGEKTQTAGELQLYPGNHPYVALPLQGHEVAWAHLQNPKGGEGLQEDL